MSSGWQPGRDGEAAGAGRAGRQAAAAGSDPLSNAGQAEAADTSAIAVNMDPAFLRREFTRVRLVATFRNGLGVSDDERAPRSSSSAACGRPGRRPGLPSGTFPEPPAQPGRAACC
jgi:hypothetical protein